MKWDPIKSDSDPLRASGWAAITDHALRDFELSGFGRAYRRASTQSQSRPTYLFQGRYEHLEQLVITARACGYAEVEMSLMTPHLTAAVLIDRPSRPNARFDCLAEWIRQHPETGFGEDL